MSRWFMILSAAALSVTVSTAQANGRSGRHSEPSHHDRHDHDRDRDRDRDHDRHDRDRDRDHDRHDRDHRDRDEYFSKHSEKFSDGFRYKGRDHDHWTHRKYFDEYGCYCYYCPYTTCYYFWYETDSCYYPCSYWHKCYGR